MATNPNSMVQEAVDVAISKRGEIGLQVVAYVDGKQVVDVWGGLADITTLMSAFARCRRVNWWLASKRWFWALPGRAGGAVVETTVDHTLMRGSEPHDR
jgi:hypothetical protein